MALHLGASSQAEQHWVGHSLEEAGLAREGFAAVQQTEKRFTSRRL